MSKQNQLEKIVREYRLAGGVWPTTSHAIARWAMANRRWEQPQDSALRQCAREISRAMRAEYVRDGSGRKVRVKHAVVLRDGDAQTVLWDDIRTASRDHMEVSFQQRRERIVGDCKQLKTDVDSYNASHPAGDPLQIVFDFRNDLAELEGLEGAA
jgi:hypothetical protein